MKKSVDFRAQYEEKMRLFDGRAADSIDSCEAVSERLGLMIDMVGMQESQYSAVKSESRWQKLEHEYYDIFCEIAEGYGGCVELEIDEVELLGTLTYKGKELCAYRQRENANGSFWQVIDAADSVYFGMENENVILELRFNLFYRVRTSDRTREIAEINKKLQNLSDEG